MTATRPATSSENSRSGAVAAARPGEDERERAERLLPRGEGLEEHGAHPELAQLGLLRAGLAGPGQRLLGGGAVGPPGPRAEAPRLGLEPHVEPRQVRQRGHQEVEHPVDERPDVRGLAAEREQRPQQPELALRGLGLRAADRDGHGHDARRGHHDHDDDVGQPPAVPEAAQRCDEDRRGGHRHGVAAAAAGADGEGDQRERADERHPGPEGEVGGRDQSEAGEARGGPARPRGRREDGARRRPPGARGSLLQTARPAHGAGA